MSRTRRLAADRIFDRSGAVPPPSRRDQLADIGALARNLSGFGEASPAIDTLPRGDGHAVLVIPALLSSDFRTRAFRRRLAELGYRVEGWGAGRNLGPTQSGWRIAERRLIAMAEHSAGRVSLIGHSLGGVLARALAYEHPELVRQVITVCSPFSLPTAVRFPALHRIALRWPIDPDFLLSRLAQPPPVPTTAIYSPRDGVVAWVSCIDRPGPGRENIAIAGAHSTMLANPATIRAVAACLARRPP